jgi:hypothetical protein
MVAVTGGLTVAFAPMILTATGKFRRKFLCHFSAPDKNVYKIFLTLHAVGTETERYLPIMAGPFQSQTITSKANKIIMIINKVKLTTLSCSFGMEQSRQ